MSFDIANDTQTWRGLVMRAACARTAFAAAMILTLFGAGARAEPDVLEVFAQPGTGSDSLWMADAKGVFAKNNLQVKIRLFASGTTAFQTFRTGAGEIIFSGDLPALQYWQNGGSYQVITPINRDFGSYQIATKKEIKSAKDMVGKSISTRVGSTGSWFVSEYLNKNGIDEKSVTIKNLDPPLMPVALCQGDIDGFFIWLPAPTKAIGMCPDKVHILGTAEGYVKGYSVAGARKEWLADPKNADKVVRFLKSLREGAEIAAKDAEGATAVLVKRFGLTPEEIAEYRGIMERVLKQDDAFFADFCSENKWQQRAGLRPGPSDLADWVWPDGLKAIDPKLVVAAPPPC
jgi:NitT/TauT family transport system substrate-binding protein